MQGGQPPPPIGDPGGTAPPPRGVPAAWDRTDSEKRADQRASASSSGAADAPNRPMPRDGDPAAHGNLPVSSDAVASAEAGMYADEDSAYAHHHTHTGNDETAYAEAGDDGSGAVQPIEGDIPRPAGAPGRPFTRRMDRAGKDGKGNKGRKVVYVDHHHVHHHHHFHEPSDWGGPGSIPPNAERQSLELTCETDAERAKSLSGAGAAFQRKPPGHNVGASVRPGGGGRVASARVGTAGSAKPSSASRLSGPEAELVYTAESLFSRDACWPLTMSTTLRTSTGSSSTSPSAGSKQLLPLSEYLSLVSQLTPETRLKFSPYGVPRSARATAGAFGALNGPFGSARGIR